VARLFLTGLWVVTGVLAALLWARQGSVVRWWEAFGPRPSLAAGSADVVTGPVQDSPERALRPTSQRYPLDPASAGYPTTDLPDPAEAALDPLAVVPNAKPLESTRVLARVGSEVILAGDVEPFVQENLRALRGRIKPEQMLISEARKLFEESLADQYMGLSEDQLQEFAPLLAERRVKQLVETRQILAEARRKIPAENMSKILAKFEGQFDKGEFPHMLKACGARTRADLDGALRDLGTSLERERKAFAEKTLAQGWVRQQIKLDEEITHAQLVAWYREHAEEYEFPARVRWEQLMVRFASYATPEEAQDLLAAMGNQVLDGADFAEVARAKSEGPTSSEGGVYNWTSQGSLKSQALDQALFEMPVGQLSPILKDEVGCHIIRVLERTGAGRTPFEELQPEIKGKIRQERVREQALKYIAAARSKSPAWTVFDREGAEEAAARAPRDSRAR